MNEKVIKTLPKMCIIFTHKEISMIKELEEEFNKIPAIVRAGAYEYCPLLKNFSSDYLKKNFDFELYTPYFLIGLYNLYKKINDCITIGDVVRKVKKLEENFYASNIKDKKSTMWEMFFTSNLKDLDIYPNAIYIRNLA